MAGADGSRVSIAAGTGGMTITPKGGLLVRLPYAGAMSRHHGWGKYTECYAEDAPCAEGGIYLYIRQPDRRTAWSAPIADRGRTATTNSEQGTIGAAVFVQGPTKSPQRHKQRVDRTR